jgi:hypothetical protein
MFIAGNEKVALSEHLGSLFAKNGGGLKGTPQSQLHCLFNVLLLKFVQFATGGNGRNKQAFFLFFF